MKKLIILALFSFVFTSKAFSKSMVYIPEKWRVDERIDWFEVVYMWYDKNGDYVVLIENGDQDLLDFEKSGREYSFFEIRGIDPKTVMMRKFDDKGKYYIGKFKENYDCSKFKFYEVVYDENWKLIRKPKINSCFGYKYYSYKDLTEMGIFINILNYGEVLNEIR